MFKLVALLGLVTGAAAYGLYHHTNLFCCDGDDGQCCLLDKKPCCDRTVPVAPPCCTTGSECCDLSALCCVAGTAVTAGMTGEKSEACCAGKTKPVAAKAACCADPCPLCATVCDECCPACPTVCGSCCGTSAQVAVAGAAAVAGAPKK